ncbi:hypothetical protein [Photobacterium angustum]|uniref:Uncharacterized protein n=1 Tax=Photobacterium angustum TaxID=661 RepID=A0A855SFI8_PHOAN|nr:hypothetical protein [Photobacterium angustum]KJF79636.1 hypothetical protein UB36_21400 [Photobacterium damselae subsp. damselae]KJG42406.1 hypothetical protein UA31_21405 [Photobacterium angustum]KJG42480.1 hypothetical protein UA35_00220 [Photobacterium angustum]KJG49777.1 hypothetical protein UA30_04350 [Photobacterium angustum]KJG54119.1 hypothetical protein UA34_07790 [Photobacterium angustum]
MKYKAILLALAVIGMIYSAVSGLKGSSTNIKSLDSFGTNTPYSISVTDAKNFGIPNSGVFGEFSSCFKKIRSKSARKIKEDDGGESGLLRVNSGVYKIYLSVYSNEAYSIRLIKLDKEGEILWQTTSYSINCDLNLFN